MTDPPATMERNRNGAWGGDGMDEHDQLRAAAIYINQLTAQNERLRKALESIGTDCRYEANEKRCALEAEGGMPEWLWCDGCAAWAALNPEKADWR